MKSQGQNQKIFWKKKWIFDHGEREDLKIPKYVQIPNSDNGWGWWEVGGSSPRLSSQGASVQYLGFQFPR